MDPIHLFVPTFRIEECLAQIRECLEKGWTGIGFKTVTFEDRLEGIHGAAPRSLSQFLHRGAALGDTAAEEKERFDWSDGDEVIAAPPNLRLDQPLHPL